MTTKEELTADKAALDSKRETLLTKAGAEAFIADQIARIDAVLPTLEEPKLKGNQVSMKTFLSLVKSRMVKSPVQVVEAEIVRTEKQLVEIDAEIKAIEVKAEPIGKERL